MRVKSKTEAQHRVDQIASFRQELAQLEHSGVVALDEEQSTRIMAYHNKLIDRLTEDFDVDSTQRVKQLSLGMKISSFLGAMALGASLFFLFYQFWGNFSVTTQVTVLVAAPILSLIATWIAVEREKSGYFAKLFGSVSFTCFVLNVSMLGQIFNISPTENAFLVWAVFAFILAYAIDARLLLVAGILCLTGFISARTGTWGGCYWLDFGNHPENFFPASLLLFGLSFFRHHHFYGFRIIYRISSLLLFFIPVLILSNWGDGSYLVFSEKTIEYCYQFIGFVGSAITIWLGIKQGWKDVVNTGNVFFTVFLYTKFYDWWWDWLPKYLFFLLIALVAILMLLIFKRLRQVAVNGEGQ
jgi:uncharacterized membrane protein